MKHNTTVQISIAQLRLVMRQHGWQRDDALCPGTIGKSTYYSILSGKPVRASTARSLALKLGVPINAITDDDATRRQP